MHQINPGEFAKILDKTDAILNPPTDRGTDPHTSENIISRGEEE
jgi:hypothetical protein